MKQTKKAFLLLVFLFLFALPVAAEEEDGLYQEQFRNSGMDEVETHIPQGVKEYFEENGIDPADTDWVDAFSAENVFSHILRFVREGAGTPFRALAEILAILLVAAALNASEQKGGAVNTAVYAAALAAAAVVIVPVFSVVRASIDALKGISVFLFSFIPVFAAVAAASGKPASSLSMSALLLSAAEGVSAFSSFLVSPLMGGYLALSVSGAISPLIKKSGIAEAVKKVSLWIMGLITTVFTAVLGVQTAVNGAADTLSMKTAKFIVGSAVPVAGSALSEALSTVAASMGLLRSSVGIYGAVVCLITFLPLILEILLWRVSVCLGAAAAELFSLPEIVEILKAIDSVLGMLAGMLLLIGAMFLLCLAIVLSAGRTV